MPKLAVSGPGAAPSNARMIPTRSRSARMYAPCSSVAGARTVNCSPPTRAASGTLVELGEAVEVSEDDAQRLTRAARPLDLHVERLLEPAAVEQTGERVAFRGHDRRVLAPRRQPVADERDEQAGARQRGDRHD